MTTRISTRRFSLGSLLKRFEMQRCHVGIDMMGKSARIVTIDTFGGQPRLHSVNEIRTSSETESALDDHWDFGLIDRLPVATESCRWITSASVPTHWVECHTVPTKNSAVTSKTADDKSEASIETTAAVTSVSWMSRPDAPAKSTVHGDQAKLIRYASSIDARGYEVTRLLPRCIAVQSAASTLLGIDCVATIVIEDDGIELVVNQNESIGLIRNYPSSNTNRASGEETNSHSDGGSVNRREIVSQIDRAIQYAAREDKSIYDKQRPILIAGRGALDSGWDRTLARYLNRPVATWQSQLEIQGSPVTLDASFAVAVSLAWSGYAADCGAGDSPQPSNVPSNQPQSVGGGA